MFVASWRHALQNNWPFIIILLLYVPLLLPPHPHPQVAALQAELRLARQQEAGLQAQVRGGPPMHEAEHERQDKVGWQADGDGLRGGGGVWQGSSEGLQVGGGGEVGI